MKLSKRDLQIVVNALIFTGTTDACISTMKGQKKYVNLAVKMKKMFNVDPDATIYLYKGSCYEEPEIAKKIVKNFSIKIEE